MMRNYTSLIPFLLVCILPLSVFAENRDMEILGWVENTRLIDPSIELKAKLDTGAETSSLDAQIVKRFRKGGRRWVRFRLRDPESGEEFLVVRERKRTIGVVQHDGNRQTRPVVEMELCIAGRILKTEVSLIDRSEFNYPLLLGRSALLDFALIDSSSTFTSDADCAGQAGESAQ